ncbi:Crp/Fnr family transcriptional regulator [Streptomyces yaanensis]|uniref:Crp/Fnr family transcriptional regulator n=1 Tax=Streptomyces yaanensis TaxID=1142239 RepID=A0ABV7S892_9ACTN|nr:cyclic nucleotide-binding domain-containing protein [Streptomyces sp. CGMCC 4.7035]WNB99578.1 cyclic nucleotide-binding domain-containing protein [Streptomyces sp. CGMCC 4.7035]
MNTPTLLRALPADRRQRLMSLARDVSFPPGTRIFDEGARADRFWIIRTGSIALDTHVPGRRRAVIEILGPGELVGLSWLFTPHAWHLGAMTVTPMRAHEFDAAAVHSLCDADPPLGQAVTRWAGEVLAHRLRSTRTRLLDLYAPYGAGSAV